MTLSIWTSFRSLAKMNINVVKLSLNGKRLPCVVTCVAFQVVSGRLFTEGAGPPQFFCYVFRHLSGSHQPGIDSLFVADS